jgi:ketosteroid isomerase-like protein
MRQDSLGDWHDADARKPHFHRRDSRLEPTVYIVVFQPLGERASVGLIRLGGRSRASRDTARAMSQENVDLARRSWTADAFTELFDEHVVMDSREHPVPDLPDVLVGREKAINAFRHYWGTWDEYAIDPVEFIDAGQSVVVVVHEHGRGRGSGIPVERHHFQMWTFRRGRIVRWEAFADKAAALQAAGLSEEAMSQENVESLRRSTDAFNRRDKAAWLATFDPAAEVFPARDWPEHAVIRGAEAIWAFYAEVTGAWEEGEFEFGEIIEAGTDKLVANVRREARGKTSGAAVAFDYWAVTTFRDGKQVRGEWFAHRDEALEAAGLSE